MPELPPADAPPPLVTRVEVPPPAPAPRKPRPGFWGAVLWSLFFLTVQLGSAIAMIVAVLGVAAARSDDAGKFLNDQLAGFVSAAAKAGPNDPPRPPVPTEIGQALAYGMLAAQVASVGAILLVVPRVIGRDWRRQIGVRVPAGLHVFLAVLVVPAFMLLAEGIQELFLRFTGITRPAANEALNGTFATVPLAVTLLAVAVGPGVVEEFWCRGFLGRGLCARYGLRWGVLATSVLFGLLHMDPSLVFITGLMGAYLHFVYLAARSIWVPVVLHLLNNGLTILALLSPTLQAAGKALQDDKQGYRAVIDIAALGLIVFASVALWTSRAKLSDEPVTDLSPEAGDWVPEYPGISAPPPEAERQVEYGEVSPAAMVLALGSFGVLAYLLSQYAP